MEVAATESHNADRGGTEHGPLSMETGLRLGEQTGHGACSSQPSGPNVSSMNFNPHMDWDYFFDDKGTRIDILATVATRVEQSSASQKVEGADAAALSTSTLEPERGDAEQNGSGSAQNGPGRATESHGCKCGDCGATFPVAVDLEAHWQYTHSKCHCGEWFEDPEGMEGHKRSVHGPMGDKYRPYLCTVCGAKFRVARHLHQHLFSVHRDRQQKTDVADTTQDGQQATKGVMNVLQDAAVAKETTQNVCGTVG